MKPIAGRACDVAAYLRSKQTTALKTEAELMLKAQSLLLGYGPEENVVVEFRYPDTTRTHVVVNVCDLVGKCQ
jgi:hypothetical protein